MYHAAAPVDALSGALRDPYELVREAAAGALGRLKAKAAVEALLAATTDDAASVRREAASALVAIGDPRARARLAEFAARDPDRRVRAAAGATSKP